MRAVVQRVKRAKVTVDDRITGEIKDGLLVFVGVGRDDNEADAKWLAEKLAGLRIFHDDNEQMNESVVDIAGSVLLVSQFTLHGDARKGRRPSFITAADPAIAKPLYESVGASLTALGIPTAYGEFGADMQVELVNDGPVTILLDSKRIF
ncbi:MAG: D-aminoacyl-tRNA deacylase [Candidatus Eremiobacteraeota bacterium]|nr:D-aminoacyl-tRNA deacylase [Candidatus Eremiobacteraeota bacterium]